MTMYLSLGPLNQMAKALRYPRATRTETSYVLKFNHEFCILNIPHVDKTPIAQAVQSPRD